jgi:hypothetical protein
MAALEMDLPYWFQEFGDPSALLGSIADEATRTYCDINYGPWDRMFGNEAILEGVKAKPRGANYYPDDISEEEFRIASKIDSRLSSPFTMVRWDKDRHLTAIPYHEFFHSSVERSIRWIKLAASNTESAQFRRFLELRAEALHTDKYGPSEVAWLENSDSNLDLLIGPTEIEDRLFGIKTAYTGTLFVRKRNSETWLKKLQSRTSELAASLPIPNSHTLQHLKIKSDLRVYDMVYAAGLDRCYLPSGLAWPADESIQTAKGIRSIVVENVLRAKFSRLFLPLAELLIVPSQVGYVSSDARFLFVLLHELAHGMGVNDLGPKGQSSRESLRDLNYPLEETKANIIALWLADQLVQRGGLGKGELMPLYVTSLLALLYNIDSRQSVLQLNYFIAAGAYVRDAANGHYSVHPSKIAQAAESLLQQVLLIQAKGDYDAARSLLRVFGETDDALAMDSERINNSEFPIGIFIEEESA